MDQAGQVDPVEGEGALQSLFLDAIAFLSDQARSSREPAHLDIGLHPLPNLHRQLGACDWLPFIAAVMSGIHLTVVLARMLAVVNVSCLRCVQTAISELEVSSAKRLFEKSWCLPGFYR